jgi:hypothetical protein
MAARKETDEDAIDDVLLADNDFADFTPDGVELRDCLLDRGFIPHDSILGA